MSRIMMLESRLRKVEELQREKGAGTYIFFIGPTREYKSVEEVDKEIEKAKYNNAEKIIKIIDLWSVE